MVTNSLAPKNTIYLQSDFGDSVIYLQLDFDDSMNYVFLVFYEYYMK